MNYTLLPEIRSLEVVQVIRTRHARGRGMSESDPVREVVTYWSMDGERLIEVDDYSPWMKDRAP